jgi:hypothetical protein
LKQVLAERISEIGSLNQVLAERISEIERLHHAVSERDGQFDSLNHVLAERVSEIDRLHRAIRERDVHISGLTESLAERDALIAQFWSSTSWRVTLPLREIRRWTKAPRRQAKRYISALRGVGRSSTFSGIWKRIRMSVPRE